MASNAELDALEKKLKQKETFKKLLRDGFRFRKVRRLLGPKPIHFCATPIVNAFFIKELMNGAPDRTLKKIELQSIKDIVLGESSSAWHRKKAKEGPSVCFSLVTDTKNIDFHAESQDQRDRFVEALRFIMENR